MIYTVHIYYSKHETSAVERLEIPHNYGYGKDMTAQTKPLPPVPLPTKAK